MRVPDCQCRPGRLGPVMAPGPAVRGQAPWPAEISVAWKRVGRGGAPSDGSRPAAPASAIRRRRGGGAAAQLFAVTPHPPRTRARRPRWGAVKALKAKGSTGDGALGRVAGVVWDPMRWRGPAGGGTVVGVAEWGARRTTIVMAMRRLLPVLPTGQRVGGGAGAFGRLACTAALRCNKFRFRWVGAVGLENVKGGWGDC